MAVVVSFNPSLGIVTIAAAPGEDISGWTLESYWKNGNTAKFRESGDVDFSNPQVSVSDPSIVYFTGTFALTNGNQRDAVALVDGNGNLVDVVGWGNDNNYELVGGTANGQHISTSNGNFAGDNDQDWYARTPDNAWDGDNASTDDGLPEDLQPYSPPCFAAGTLIDTPDGRRLVEMIEVGDLVLNDRGEAREVRWIGKRCIHLSPSCRGDRLRPVIIRAGAFGEGYPDSDLRLSPQHRVVVGGANCQLHFGMDEVLVAAKHLINGTTVLYDRSCTSIDYIHILLDHHEIVISNGLPSESFHPGPNVLGVLDLDQRNELFEIFPELQFDAFAYGKACLPVLRRVEACLI